MTKETALDQMANRHEKRDERARRFVEALVQAGFWCGPQLTTPRKPISVVYYVAPPQSRAIYRVDPASARYLSDKAFDIFTSVAQDAQRGRRWWDNDLVISADDILSFKQGKISDECGASFVLPTIERCLDDISEGLQGLAISPGIKFHVYPSQVSIALLLYCTKKFRELTCGSSRKGVFKYKSFSGEDIIIPLGKEDKEQGQLFRVPDEEIGSISSTIFEDLRRLGIVPYYNRVNGSPEQKYILTGDFIYTEQYNHFFDGWPGLRPSRSIDIA